MRRPVAILALLLVLAGAARAAAPELAVEVARLHADLDAWAVTAAGPAIERLHGQHPDSPAVQQLTGRYAFLRGEYGRAVTLLAQARRQSQPPRGEDLLALATATRDLVGGYQRVALEPVHLYVAPGTPDRILAPYAAAVVAAQVEALRADLGWTPDLPLRVEILPDPRTLGRITGLTESAIETSGTIAVAKFNKLMLISPRALVRGYGWQDTLGHELTHLALSQVSRNTAALWLQEAVAKTLEARYRTPLAEVELAPRNRHLLALAGASGKLLSFASLNPSFAYLPSQESAALAYAQVWSLLQMLLAEQGVAGLQRLIGELATGAPEDQALRAVYGAGFHGLVARWKQYLKRQKLQPQPGLAEFGLEFAAEGVDPEKRERARIEDRKVRDHLTLGDLLYARGRHRAAGVEYGRARSRTAEVLPLIQRRLARALVEAGEPARAAAELDRALELYPRHPALLVDRAGLALAAEERERARDLFEQVVAINPFDPRSHAALATLYHAAGREAEARREHEVLTVLKTWLEER